MKRTLGQTKRGCVAQAGPLGAIQIRIDLQYILGGQSGVCGRAAMLSQTPDANSLDAVLSFGDQRAQSFSSLSFSFSQRGWWGGRGVDIMGWHLPSKVTRGYRTDGK